MTPFIVWLKKNEIDELITIMVKASKDTNLRTLDTTFAPLPQSDSHRPFNSAYPLMHSEHIPGPEHRPQLLAHNSHRRPTSPDPKDT